MAEFDPQAYLNDSNTANVFDPSAYLAQDQKTDSDFDPQAYLESPSPMSVPTAPEVPEGSAFETRSALENAKSLQASQEHLDEKSVFFDNQMTAFIDSQTAYNNKKKDKGIYGTASKQDLKELKEEGIDAQMVPWFEKENN